MTVLVLSITLTSPVDDVCNPVPTIEFETNPEVEV